MSRRRARITINGAVQGVGFRPFVYRLANELRLDGWVSNSTQGVLMETEGSESQLTEFLARLQKEKPPIAVIERVTHSLLRPVPYHGFEIRESDTRGSRTALILPDIATCADCLREIFDPNDRRFRYPFTNCTHCGPRFSIIEALPYDRANTSMKHFAMCPDCNREYHDPLNRRFHAQPNACPRCGPRLELWDADGHLLRGENGALIEAAALVQQGQIIALKGIGGFQLIADARSEEAVQRLRARKCREEKPFALMFSSLAAAEESCSITDREEQLLTSAASPIVLVRKRSGRRPNTIAAPVAPGNPNLGIMLPCSPLHHLLMRELGFPVVATSGNLSDEPISTDEQEAVERLRGIADAFLVHNRPIVRHLDDSVVRIISGRETILRRARGYAPLPVQIKNQNSRIKNIFAVGAHLKNAVALGLNGQAFLSQHIGDLETAQAYAAFRKSSADLPRLYRTSLQIIAHDLHPEYLSTKFALERRSPDRRHLGNADPQRADREIAVPTTFPVQHHYAHVLSCMADNELEPPVLGISWDGTGFGPDGTIWGGEFLLVTGQSFERFAHFRTFRLPGGDAAVKQPRRCALGLLFEIFGKGLLARRDQALRRHFPQSELRMFERMLAGGINSPVTSSAGRLFDAVAAITGLRQRVSFEGQAAMDLEFASANDVQDAYSFELRNGMPRIFDWEPMVREILDDLRTNQPVGVIAAKFHNTLAEVAVAVARAAGERNVVLSGGCFQNCYLTERIIRRLQEENFCPHWHRRIPPNDGGVALGQIMAALRSEVSAPRKVRFKPDSSVPKNPPQLAEPLSRL